MKMGRLARGVGKVGLLIEGLAYIATAGKALFKAVRGRSAPPPNELDDPEDGSNAQQDQLSQQ